MADINYSVEYGTDVAVIPKKALQKINAKDSSKASHKDIKFLTALLECLNKGYASSKEVREVSGLSEEEIISSESYWRGVGVIGVNSGDSPSKIEKKILVDETLPTYTGSEIAKVVEKSNNTLKDVIDECQNIMGHVFSANEQNSFIAFIDSLCLEPDFILTLCQYYSKKKGNNLSLRYIEKAVSDLMNNGVTTVNELNAYLRRMEIYDGVAGKLRKLAGIGERQFTKNENQYLKTWLSWGYDDNMLEYAYELTVDRIGKFNFDYANQILKGWHENNILTIEAAKLKQESYKKDKNAPLDTNKGTFSTDGFFGAAVKRSLNRMADDSQKEENKS